MKEGEIHRLKPLTNEGNALTETDEEGERGGGGMGGGGFFG